MRVSSTWTCRTIPWCSPSRTEVYANCQRTYVYISLYTDEQKTASHASLRNFTDKADVWGRVPTGYIHCARADPVKGGQCCNSLHSQLLTSSWTEHHELYEVWFVIYEPRQTQSCTPRERNTLPHHTCMRHASRCCRCCVHYSSSASQVQCEHRYVKVTKGLWCYVRAQCDYISQNIWIDDDVFYLFLQKQKIGAELHIYLEEGTYNKRLFRGSNTNDMKKCNPQICNPRWRRTGS